MRCLEQRLGFREGGLRKFGKSCGLSLVFAVALLIALPTLLREFIGEVSQEALEVLANDDRYGAIAHDWSLVEGVNAEEKEIADPVRAPDDPAVALIKRIKDGDYNNRGDVAAGRFLDHFEVSRDHLFRVDEWHLKLERKGRGWFLVRAPYAKDFYKPSWATEDQVAQLRFVNRDDNWKLECVKLLPKQQP